MPLRLFVFLAAASISAASALQASPTPTQAPCSQDHIQWVTQALMRMETIKPGMTRKELPTVFKISRPYLQPSVIG